MEILDIRDNFLKEESVDEMSKLIRTCNKLHSLNVSDCNLTKDDNEKIITALEVIFYNQQKCFIMSWK